MSDDAVITGLPAALQPPLVALTSSPPRGARFVVHFIIAMLLASIFELLGEEFPQLREGSSPHFHLKGSLRIVLTTPILPSRAIPKPFLKARWQRLRGSPTPNLLTDQPTNGPMGELFASSSLGS